jgi:peptidyl-prolyl cis-trans isomerase SurA
MTNFNPRKDACAVPRPALRRNCLAVLMLAAALPLAAPAQGLRPSAGTGLGSPAARPLSTAQRPADFIVVVVNSEPITNNEVLARLVRTEQQLAQQGGTRPSREILARQVLESLINEKAQLQLAREAGMKVDDAAVAQAELTIATQNQVSVAELERRIRQDGMDVRKFREDLRNQLLLTQLREREMAAKVRVTEFDIDQYIQEKQGGSDASSTEINIAHVLIAVPENATPTQIAALQARAELVATRARAGEDFAALVREFSDAPDKEKSGGQVGLRRVDRYPPLFIDATKSLGVGGIGGPARSAAGFHVMKVVERRQGALPAMTVTQSRSRHILLRPDTQLTESAAVARLSDFRRRIVAGQADFATLARENSQDGSANEGGDLGWTNPGQFVPEFEEALNRLSPGQISQPVVSRFGVHLIQLQERREGTLSQREQREIVRNLVREKKMEEAAILWAQDVRGRAYIEYREPPQ